LTSTRCWRIGNQNHRLLRSGGVGKTTTAAALGLRAAEQHGADTVVLTIDPARRLAQSMGLTELDNTPRQVKGIDAGATAASSSP
jgi:anion-transporting  ArsA/GET3 family ATPase